MADSPAPTWNRDHIARDRTVDHIPVPPKPKLLDQVRNTLRVNHYSLRAEEAYLQWIRRFILFHGKRHPADMGSAEINSFLSHLAVEDGASALTS